MICGLFRAYATACHEREKEMAMEWNEMKNEH